MTRRTLKITKLFKEEYSVEEGKYLSNNSYKWHQPYYCLWNRYMNKVEKSYSIAIQSNEGNTETSRKKSDTNQTDNEECEYII